MKNIAIKAFRIGNLFFNNNKYNNNHNHNNNNKYNAYNF